MINMTWFCYSLLFSMTAFAVVIIWLLHCNTKVHEELRRCKMELEALNEAVQHLWRENDKAKK